LELAALRFRSEEFKELEIVVLRQEVTVLRREVGRPELGPVDRPRLVIGEATAKTHVARILQKLGLHDRVQAVIHAYATRLVASGSTA